MFAASPDEQLRAVLAQYPSIGPWQLRERRAGFSGAGIWRVETDAGPLAVRRWPAGTSVTRLRGLHRVLATIRESGCDFVAVPLRTERDNTIIELFGAAWQVEPWLPGVADFHQHASPNRLRAAMHALAGWHHAAARFHPRGDELAWFAPPAVGVCPAVRERLEQSLQLSPARLNDWATFARRVPAELTPIIERLHCGVAPALPRIVTELRSMSAEPVPLQICLRDVWHDHLLYTGEVVTGLVDPSAARTDSVAGDLARLLGSLVEDRTADWQLALDEYRRLHSLSLAEERLVPILDRSGIVLSAANWLRWLGPDQRSGFDTAVVTERLRRLADRLDRIAFG